MKFDNRSRLVTEYKYHAPNCSTIQDMAGDKTHGAAHPETGQSHSIKADYDSSYEQRFYDRFHTNTRGFYHTTSLSRLKNVEAYGLEPNADSLDKERAEAHPNDENELFEQARTVAERALQKTQKTEAPGAPPREKTIALWHSPKSTIRHIDLLPPAVGDMVTLRLDPEPLMSSGPFVVADFVQTSAVQRAAREHVLHQTEETGLNLIRAAEDYWNDVCLCSGPNELEIACRDREWAEVFVEGPLPPNWIVGKLHYQPD